MVLKRGAGAELESEKCDSAHLCQIPKISPVALIVVSLDNRLVLHASCNCQPFVFIVV